MHAFRWANPVVALARYLLNVRWIIRLRWYVISLFQKRPCVAVLPCDTVWTDFPLEIGWTSFGTKINCDFVSKNCGVQRTPGHISCPVTRSPFSSSRIWPSQQSQNIILLVIDLTSTLRMVRIAVVSYKLSCCCRAQGPPLTEICCSAVEEKFIPRLFAWFKAFVGAWSLDASILGMGCSRDK